MKKILIALGLALLAFFIFLAYSGLLTSVKITEKEIGPYYLVYQKHTGDYKNMGKVQMNVYNIIIKNTKVKPKIGFGIYYDNPEKTAKDKLQSEGGCIVSKKEADAIKKAKTKLLFKTFEKTKCVTAEFPLKNKYSIIFGIMKAYPKINKYKKVKKYKESYALEIYDVPNKKLTFAFPVITEKK